VCDSNSGTAKVGDDEDDYDSDDEAPSDAEASDESNDDQGREGNQVGEGERDEAALAFPAWLEHLGKTWSTFSFLTIEMRCRW